MYRPILHARQEATSLPAGLQALGGGDQGRAIFAQPHHGLIRLPRDIVIVDMQIAGLLNPGTEQRYSRSCEAPTPRPAWLV